MRLANGRKVKALPLQVVVLGSITNGLPLVAPSVHRG